jgi:hypothetical protein
MKKSENISGPEKSGKINVVKKLYNQAEYARKTGISKQRMHQILEGGDFLTEFIGERLMIVDCKYNEDLVREKCCGTGNFRHESYNY